MGQTPLRTLIIMRSLSAFLQCNKITIDIVAQLLDLLKQLLVALLLKFGVLGIVQPLEVLVLHLVLVQIAVEVVDGARVAFLEQRFLLVLDSFEQTVTLLSLGGYTCDLLLAFSLLFLLLPLAVFFGLDLFFLFALFALLNCFQSLLHLVLAFVNEHTSKFLVLLIVLLHHLLDVFLSSQLALLLTLLLCQTSVKVIDISLSLLVLNSK